MRRKRWTAALLAMMLLLVGLPPAMAAEPETAKARVVFTASEPDADGRFTLTLKAFDARFSVFQFAINYDPAVLTPVDAKGTATSEFNAFAEQAANTPWMATVGTGLDTEGGLIDFCGYVTPGSRGEGGIDANGLLAAGKDGVALFSFRFRLTGTGSSGFALANEKSGKAYNPAISDGGGLVEGGNWIPTQVVFDVPKAFAPPVTEAPIGNNGTGTGEEPHKMTREQRLKDTVILQIGNSHASVAGTRTAIYRDEPNVTAYAADNRTYVPVRFIAEQMGAKVDWEQKTSTVVITKDKKVIRMPLDSKTYTVDGVSKEMDVTPQLKGEPGSATQRTMVPIRFVAEALKMDVQWDKDSNTVIIAPASAPWDLKGTVERGILMDT
ncbi:MAG: stalk domain-containing protein, partial [Oscillospiraceae bacterium]